MQAGPLHFSHGSEAPFASLSRLCRVGTGRVGLSSAPGSSWLGGVVARKFAKQTTQVDNGKMSQSPRGATDSFPCPSRLEQ